MLLSSRSLYALFFFFSSRRRHTRLVSDWSSDVCSSDLQIQADQATEYPAQKLPRDPRRDVGNAADPPQAAGEHAHGNDAPGDVENDKDEREPAARRERQALPQVEVQQQLRRCEQQQIN